MSSRQSPITPSTDKKIPSSLPSNSPPILNKLGPIDHLIAGVQAGAIMVIITNPLWLAKTRLQLQGTYAQLGIDISSQRKYVSLLGTNNVSYIQYKFSY